jgi:hypothetical protein
VTHALVRLTLVFPPALEGALSEALITAPNSPGFTLLHGEGHSSDFPRASTAEQVRGRIDRRVILVVVQAEALEPLIRALKQRVPSHDIVWWSEPVLELGRLA